MELEEDEEVVLDNGIFGSMERLVLTNKRLLLQTGTLYFFRVSWETQHEIPLSDIEEAYAEMGDFLSLSTLNVRLKNKEVICFSFKLKGSQMLATMGNHGIMITKVKAITDEYVTAINNRIKEKPQGKQSGKENPLHLLQIRYAKGEISKEEYEEMRQVLEEGKNG